VHIHDNFENYGVLEMVAVKFVHYMFFNMDSDLAFENYLKHWLVHGDIP